MSQLFESVVLALASIWANKLRSLLTLLGNIVAVSSIITVVALITGVNAAVTDAIVSDLGADSFTDPADGHHAERRRLRADAQQPARDDGGCLRGEAVWRPRSARSWRRPRRRPAVAYRDEELETLQVQGVSEEYLDFATFDAELGRMITPTEIKRKRPVTLIGWGTSPIGCSKAADPLDKQIRIAGVPFTVVGVSTKKGAAFGQSLDEFVVIPLGSVSEAVRRATIAGADGQAARRDARQPTRATKRASRCASSAG